MNQQKDNKERRAAVIAACVTFGLALIILVVLFKVTLGYDRQALTEASIPEIQDLEEVYLEPELLPIVEDAGSETEEDLGEPSPQPVGEPDPGETEQPERIVKNPEPPREQPVDNRPRQVATEKPAEVKAPNPKVSEEDEKRIASVAGKFKTDNNGSPSGRDSDNAGVGGAGVGAQGSLNGRKMLSCSTWKLILSQKVVIKVNVTVDADGNVTKATAVSGAGTPNLRAQCEKMAKTSKWTPKPGAEPTTGTITFTIIPG